MYSHLLNNWYISCWINTQQLWIFSDLSLFSYCSTSNAVFWMQIILLLSLELWDIILSTTCSHI